jgi:hypothetical protein
MAQHWIIDVLSDMTTFARANGLAALAVQLEHSRCVALRELEAAQGVAPAAAQEDAAATHILHRPAAIRLDA